MKAEQMLVSTETLAAHLGDPDWIVFDTRHDLAWPDKGRQAWEAAHVPGAYFMHLDHDLSGTKTGKNGRHPLPPLADFAARMNRCGVAPGRQVVVYDDGGGSFAVRLWWMLWWLGHDKVALLDGGIAAWKRENRPMDALVPAAREGRFEPRPRETMMARAHAVSTSERLCVERRTVRSLPMCFRYSRNSAFSLGSRSLVGSSRMRIGGSWMRACARPTRCR